MVEILHYLTIASVFMGVGHVQGSSSGWSIGKLIFWLALVPILLTSELTDNQLIACAVGFIGGYWYARSGPSYFFGSFIDSLKFKLRQKFQEKHESTSRFEQDDNFSSHQEKARKRAEEAARERKNQSNSGYSSSSSRSGSNGSRKQSRTEAEYEEVKRQARKAREEAEAAQAEAEWLRAKSKSSNEPAYDPRSPEEILGLKPGFTKADLKEGYRRESARFHENKWINKPKHVQEAMQEELKRINWAKDKLSG